MRGKFFNIIVPVWAVQTTKPDPFSSVSCGFSSPVFPLIAMFLERARPPAYLWVLLLFKKIKKAIP